MSNILTTVVSSFRNTRSTEVVQDDIKTVNEWLSIIRDGKYKSTISALRDGDVTKKLQLPTISFHGVFDSFRNSKNFIEASGLIIIDIDDVPQDEIEDAKQEIIDEHDSVLAAMISPSGTGIKLLYLVEPDLVNTENYRSIGKVVAPKFEMYGSVDFLSVTDCLIVTWDPNILINEQATPDFIVIKNTIKKVTEIEKLDSDKTLWDNAEDFFDTVLANDIESKTNNNFHYMQVAVLDLAKFGFKHPQEDLSFIVDYAESVFGRSSKNKQRFLDVAELVKDYPQLKWPYKTIYSDDEDDDYVDYSDWVSQDNIKAKSKDSDNDDSNEQETDGLVDYSTLFKDVLSVIAEGDRVGFETANKNFADIFRFRGTGILTVTGIPGHGKTEMVDSWMLDLARLYGHETIVAGFEQTPQEHIIKLIRKMVGTNVTCASYNNNKEIKAGYDFVVSKFKHIDTNKTGGNINEILEVCAKQIKKSRDAGGDPKYVVLDPFNMLSIKGKFSGHEKIEEILRRLTHFSHQMGVLIILIAHPFKMRMDDDGVYAVPDFYSVKGSSAFFEMSYHGIVVYRTGYLAENPVWVRILKVKQNNLGNTGEEAYYTYNKASGRYNPIDGEGNEDSGDHRDQDWLSKINLK